MADLRDRAIEEEIDGVAYKVWPVPFSIGRPALVRLLGILSPILAAAFRGGTRDIAGVFEALPAALGDSDLQYFGKVFGDAAQYKNDKGDWCPLVDKVQADHFAGRYLAFFQWIVLAVRCNYGGFFDGIRSGVGGADLLQMMQQKS